MRIPEPLRCGMTLESVYVWRDGHTLHRIQHGLWKHSRLAWGLAAWAGESPLKGLQLGSSVGTAMWLAHKRQDQRASRPTFICFPTPDKRQRQGARLQKCAHISSLTRSLSVPSFLLLHNLRHVHIVLLYTFLQGASTKLEFCHVLDTLFSHHMWPLATLPWHILFSIITESSKISLTVGQSLKECIYCFVLSQLGEKGQKILSKLEDFQLTLQSLLGQHYCQAITLVKLSVLGLSLVLKLLGDRPLEL